MRMTQQVSYDAAMRRALELSERGPVTGRNPRVGCALFDDYGRSVAEGWLRGVGTPRAEVYAHSLLTVVRGLPAVVTPEPCNHSGRTVPCCVALIAAGITRVVFAVSHP